MQRKSPKQVRDAVDKLLKQIEEHKKQAEREKLTFYSLPEKELIKLERGGTSKSPYAYASSWLTPVPRGYQGLYRMYLRNPDPVQHLWLFVTIFFGLGFVFDDLSQAWVGRDKRWPELTTSEFSLPPNAYSTQELQFTVPNVEPSTYLGNSVFWKQIFPNGTIYYRGGFSVAIT